MNELLDLMEQVESSGTFSVTGILASVAPGLKVKGIGYIALPIIKQQAQALIKISEQAPFGYGEETIVDPKVRNSWQIGSENFQLTNPQWEEILQQAVNDIGKQLGLDEDTIEYAPYKLLIYETGSFFKVHRDTEKMPNMFATLVINLPSEHQGGELIVSHNGHSQAYTFADKDLFHSSFVAFYADCYHEVKPITAGYRVCLIYNLAIANRTEQPRLGQQSQIFSSISQYIHNWQLQKSKNATLTYLLEHSYTEQNLCLANLKAGDFAKASVLLKAAAENDCQAFLCLATYYRTSYGETKYYGNYGRRRYSSRYDEYDEDDLDESDFEECDVDTEEVYAHSLIDITGEKLKLNKLTLDEDKLIAKTPLREGPGYGYSISEATGNEGATKDLWYHRGAVILWPKERSFELATKMDVEYAIHLLQTELQQPKPKNNKYGRHIIQLAAHIIKKHHDYEINGIATEIIQIGNIPLLKEFLQKYMSRGFDVDAKIIKQILERFGWQHFAETIHNYLIKQNSIQWLKSLMLEYAYIPEDGIPLMSEWVTELWQAELEPKYGHNSYTQKSITNVIPTVLWLNLDNLIDKIIERLATQEAPEFLTDTYGPALVDILKMLKKHYYDPLSFKKFTDDIQKRIATTLPKAPDAPTNWAREGRLNCDCPFCTKINEFLPDPKQDKIIFSKTLKRNLTHIESEISKSQVDLEVIIRRTPPKFEGICKKNSSNYNRRLDLFNRAQQILQDLGY